jgi:nucleoside-diphosphate-sugar epimerase
MSERVLVTGSSGFLGRWLRRTLAEHGFALRCFDRDAAGVDDEVVGDGLDAETVSRACHGVQAVCHLVGLQSSRRHTWSEFHDVNVRSTELLLEACLRQGVEHFVYFSTEMVYGRQPGALVREEATPRPRGPYGRSKRMAEDVCRQFEARGLRVTILRPSNIMGPGKLRVVEELFRRVAGPRRCR